MTTKREQARARALAAMERALTGTMLCIDDLAAAMCLSVKATRKHVAAATVHIGDWRHTPYPVALLTWGDGVDAPKPAPMTGIERKQASRVRLAPTVSDVDRDVSLARRRALSRQVRADPLALPVGFFRSSSG